MASRNTLTIGEGKSVTEARKKKAVHCKVFIGDFINKWNIIKTENDLKTNPDVAKLLIECYERSKTLSAQARDSDSTLSGVFPATLTSTPGPSTSKKRKTSPPMVSDISATSGSKTLSAQARDSDSTLSGVFPATLTSTPGPSTSKKRKTSPPMVSDISADSGESNGRHSSRMVLRSSSTSSDVDVTGISTGTLTEEQQQQHKEVSQLQPKTRPIQQKKLSSSFVDPLQLSISIYEESDEQEDVLEDPDYEPSFDMVLGSSKLSDIPEKSFEDYQFGEAEAGEINEDETVSSGVPAVNMDNIKDLQQDKMCLSFLQQLLVLAKTSISSCNVHGCTKPVEIQIKFVGSALYFNWVCSSDHKVHKWCSQPTVKHGLHSGDLLTSACVLFSGNNYSKISLMCNMLNLPFVSANTYFQIQRHYLVPCINEFWGRHVGDIKNQYKDKEIVILGDGRMDSPGFSAQYCTYVFMENETKQILNIETMDKRQVSRKSTNMEKACFESGIMSLSSELNLSEVVTDAHLGITALMRNKYPEIKHSHDIWHAAKNIGKQIIKAGGTKDTKALLPWTSHIQNHFWYSSQSASSVPEFVNIWYGVKHHVCNIHEWLIPEGDGPNYCRHGPLTEVGESPQPLKAGSKAATSLNTIVMNPRLIKKVPHYLHFRSTAEIENFNSVVLMYAAKRFSYTPPVYHARNLLAALDHNTHLSRNMRKNADGEIMYHRVYNKKSGRWTVYPFKEKKTYGHIPELLKDVLVMRLQDNQSLRRKAVITDVRALEKHLAPIPPPPTSTLVAELKKRR